MLSSIKSEKEGALANRRANGKPQAPGDHRGDNRGKPKKLRSDRRFCLKKPIL
jgi:hypothetical protein